MSGDRREAWPLAPFALVVAVLATLGLGLGLTLRFAGPGSGPLFDLGKGLDPVPLAEVEWTGGAVLVSQNGGLERVAPPASLSCSRG